MRKAFHDIAQRLAHAETNFIDTLMEFGGITRAEATRVFDLYRREKLIKRDAAGGVYNVTHGAFLDRDVIRRALAESGASRSGGKKRHGGVAVLAAQMKKQQKAPIQPIDPMWYGQNPACSKCGRNFVADSHGRVRKGKKDVAWWFCSECAGTSADVGKLAAEVKGLLK